MLIQFDIITLFPEALLNFLSCGVIGRALKEQKIIVNTHNPRDHATGVHQAVDDKPFGGGDGMVMRADVLNKSLESLIDPSSRDEIYYLSPQGLLWDDVRAQEWANNPKKRILICGRYGGVDQRLLQKFNIKEISIGNYVLSGGEIPAMVLVDSVARKIPSVLGNQNSANSDSFSIQSGLLEAPLFTRPSEWEGYKVPQVLLSGHHLQIQKSQELISLAVTAIKRPELINESHYRELDLAIKYLLSLPEDELLNWTLSKEKIMQIKELYESKSK